MDINRYNRHDHALNFLGVQGSDLIPFWNRTRLTVVNARTPPAEDGELAIEHARSTLERLRLLLLTGYGQRSQLVQTKVQSPMWGRTTPSAGALYPFDVFVVVVSREASMCNIYYYDVSTGHMIPLVGNTVTSSDLDRVGLIRPSDATSAAIILVARPWRSMSKYGLRGYIYSHLDAAHAASNIAIFAHANNIHPITHLRYRRERLAALLGIDGLCREPHAVITFGQSACRHVSSDGNGSSDEIYNFNTPSAEEHAAWNSLAGIRVYDAGSVPSICLKAMRALSDPEVRDPMKMIPLPGIGLRSWDPHTLQSVILKRQSAKGFLNESITIEQLGNVLSLANGTLLMDCGDGAGKQLELRIIVRRVYGLRGIFSYAPSENALYGVDLDAALDSDIGELFSCACMHQPTVRRASVLCIWHAPTGQVWNGAGSQGFSELHFQAAHSAQRLYLAAAYYALGVTSIGGFDTKMAASLARLSEFEDIVYVAALGSPDEAMVKHDRMRVAYSHGVDC